MPRGLTPYASSLFIVAAETAVCWAMHGRFERSNLIMIYLLGVVVAAAWLGRGPAVAASVLSVAAFDWFFVPPRFTFVVADTQYLVTFAVMLGVGLLISAMTDRIRQQAETARQRERRTAALLALAREMAAARDVAGQLATVARHVSELMDAEAIVLLGDGPTLTPAPATGRALPDADRIVAEWVFQHGEPAGSGTTTYSAVGGVYLPLTSSRGTLGVIGAYPGRAEGFGRAGQREMLEGFANLLALAIERAKLVDEAHSAWERVETEFLRNTLLSSVSHDLRTPLAAITGAASSLVDAGPALAEPLRLELAEMIAGESERMEGLINNLLDMTRLESGGLRLRKEWQPISEVIGAALHPLRARLEDRQVTVDVPADLPAVAIDAVAIEQVLANFLGNALLYTPRSSPLEIRAHGDRAGVTVDVLDRGPGLPKGAEQRVFEKFVRAQPAGVEANHRGLGLGLAICRGIVEAHGGTVGAANRDGGGARFWFTLPAATDEEVKLG